MAFLTIDHLSFTYTTPQAATLQDVQLNFQRGTLNLLTGASGSGKSTLLKIMAGLYPKHAGQLLSGQILVHGQPATLPDASLVALMFQNPDNQFVMDTVYEELIFTLENLQIDPAEFDDKVTAALDFVGISALRNRHLATLSGGEKQKVALAIIVAMDSQVILLDEPFASIDPQARTDILAKLMLLKSEQHKTIIIADHDLSDYQGRIDQLLYDDQQTRQVKVANEAQQTALFRPFLRKIKSSDYPLPATGRESAVVNLDHVTIKQFAREILNQPQLDFFANKVTLITGPNGIGKSTLFNALVKLKPCQGTISYAGRDIKRIHQRQYSRDIGLVFQNADRQFVAVTVKEELEASQKHSLLPQIYTPGKVAALFAQLGLEGLEERIVYSLSEGQKKRLQVLLMLIMGTPVLLLDEPFKGLDLESMQHLIDLLQQTAAEQQRTIILISHQLQGLTKFVDYHLTFEQQHLQYVGVAQ
ncbi:ABC transporter ATP-binding protein [Lactobacillus sp. CC-MHH1034]|uniref:ABC transporter ATP-binding protein n=1 Tax=Agrilactobacillus fermenti TaxID=2586909 RepID=UPI001E5C1506|nr:ABC transporter ATP-binding protein [Agrilactobacillus fermenti]MCD2255648.1 ABC transporter ATP-binding protein [Agrilactobacillus fermenti]